MQDPTFKKKNKHVLSFGSATELFAKILTLPGGISHESWKVRNITIPQKKVKKQVVGPPLQFKLYHRNIMDYISFLIGHRPFKDNLVYSSIREFSDQEKTERIYNEMHTGDWWWEAQEKLPDHSTVIPLLIASDKTQLTQHRGDLVAWPIYLTIGNLDSKTRRTPLRPGALLLAFVPALHKDDIGYKKILYHAVLDAILSRTLLDI